VKVTEVEDPEPEVEGAPAAAATPASR
jgi:hypothetical protein